MQILEKPLERLPGMVLVFGLLCLFMLENDSEPAAAIRVFVVAWVLYRLGSVLDKLFDGFYGTEPKCPPKHRPRCLWERIRWKSSRVWYRPRMWWYRFRTKYWFVPCLRSLE